MSTTAKRKRNRGPNRLYETPASVALYKRFVKPFLLQYTLGDNQSMYTDGVEAFFNVEKRGIAWCRARESFYMPGTMWLSLSHPNHLIPGTGRRYVKPGDSLVVRVDEQMPERCEVEFDRQVFVLTPAQLRVVKEKLEAVA